MAIDNNNIAPLSAKMMNLDVHPSLLSSHDIFLLINGDVSGNESNNNSWFVQNQLSNSLCFEFPENYVLNGPGIQMNQFDYALFFVINDTEGNYVSSEIGIWNSKNCTYETYVNEVCLNFNLNYPVRGVYKHLNNTNERTIYFIDGYNPNRYLTFKEDGTYPVTYTGSKCDTCDYEETADLDCDQLRINKLFTPPCLSLLDNREGQLPTGVYQVGVAYSEDNLVLTDYYFSQAIRVFSENSNIGFNVDIDCIDTPFDQFSLVLVSRTKENSLVVYNLGFYSVANGKAVITNLDNATILDTASALTKKPIYDYSQHIATNGETLLLGKHQKVEPLNYQPQANNIVVKWQEIKVPKDKAYLYPSFMRDEVYAISIEPFDKLSKGRGVFNIPGRAPLENDLLEIPEDNDIYEDGTCDPTPIYAWQVKNTATVIFENDVQCADCSGETISKEGLMGYWESENLTYPNDESTWGDLACQPIRHHKMPSHDLTHIHDNYNVVTTNVLGVEVPTRIEDPECVNILTIKLENIEHPITDGVYDQNIGGYRILVSDRNGHKSILHKGLLFNLRREILDPTIGTEEILFPNYPFNDLHEDVFLTETQSASDPAGSTVETSLPSYYSIQQFTYHSPDIHYKETEQEIGTEMKIYGESIAHIEGGYHNVYRHPQGVFGVPLEDTNFRFNYATQADSIAHYTKFDAFTDLYKSRFRITDSQYLLPVKQITGDGWRLNNFYRESSYYIRTGRNVPVPTNIDTSRVLASEVGYSGLEELPTYNSFGSVTRDAGDMDIQAVSQYVGIKIKQPDQYGPLEQIKYRPVTCIIQAEDPSGCPTCDPSGNSNYPDIAPLFYSTDKVFGGDVFITKHSLIRKMPLFTEWLYDVPETTEINYRNYRNVWFPKFWYDNLSGVNDEVNLDGSVDLAPSSSYLLAGKFYIFVTGIVDYYCESEFIGNFRERDFTPNGSFYPKATIEDLTRSDKIPLDNKYLYNFILLNNELERLYQNLNPTNSDAEFTVIYSQKDDFQTQGDPWLQFLPLNYTILPRIYGSFTGIHYTDNYSIFFIFENEILYSQVYFTQTTDQGNKILLNQGDIFSNRLTKLSNEQTGYTGSVDPLSFVNTRFGTFFIDRYRKKIFRWTGKLDDVTNNMSSWLNNYLSDTLPTYKNSIITIFDNFTENLYIADRTQTRKEDRWGLTYKPKLEGVVSFFTWTPEWMFILPNNFASSDPSGIWTHNNKFSYQQYYGEQHDFEVGILVNNQFKNAELQSVELFSEWIKYSNYGEPIYVRTEFFDELLAYNNTGSTGTMTVQLRNKKNPATVQNDKNTPTIIEVTQVNDSVYRFNKLQDFRTPGTNETLPMIQWENNGINYSAVGTDTNLNPRQRSDLKGKWIKLHLKSNTNSEHKILVQLIVPNTDETKI
jgi:hypothetical protein